MLAGPRAKWGKERGVWGESEGGRRRQCYARRPGRVRITRDTRRGLPRTPELSPFSALLRDTERRVLLSSPATEELRHQLQFSCKAHSHRCAAPPDPSQSPANSPPSPSPTETSSPLNPSPTETSSPLSPSPTETSSPLNPSPTETSSPLNPSPTETSSPLNPSPSPSPTETGSGFPLSPSTTDTGSPLNPSPTDTRSPLNPSPSPSPSPTDTGSPLCRETPLPELCEQMERCTIWESPAVSPVTNKASLSPPHSSPRSNTEDSDCSNTISDPAARAKDNTRSPLVARAVERRSLKANYRTPSRAKEMVKNSPRVTTPPIVQGCPRVPSPLLRYLSPTHSVPLSARDKILSLCEQSEPLTLDDFFSDTMVATLNKLGEGAFAEVFGCQDDTMKKLALKIIPIEGDFTYNDEKQSSFEEILPEIVVSRELNLLGDDSNKENTNAPHFTRNFLQIERMGLCEGEFPDFLMDAWDDYDFEHKSDNDRPDVFPPRQLYVVFAAEDAGMALEDYVFHSFEEARSILRQVAGTLAVGEAVLYLFTVRNSWSVWNALWKWRDRGFKALEFEHRDLHRGNVLVRRTHEEAVYFRLRHNDFLVKTHGVKATVVDYTLSRIKQGECVSYNDLNRLPWLFRGKGDIQFDTYRGMRNASKSSWDQFTPYTNVLWLNYLVVKISQRGRLKHISSRAWRANFRNYSREILNHSTAEQAFLNLFMADSQH